MDMTNCDDADPVFSPAGDFDWGPHRRLSMAVTRPALLIGCGALLLVLGVALG